MKQVTVYEEDDVMMLKRVFANFNSCIMRLEKERQSLGIKKDSEVEYFKKVLMEFEEKFDL